MICLIPFLLTACLAAQPATGYTTKKTAKGKAKKHYDAAMALNMKDENEKAIKEFEKALRQDPRFIDAQLQWAALKYVMTDFKAAETGFEKVLAIDPAYNKKVIYTLGLSEMRLEKYEEAAGHFKQYLDAKPKNTSLKQKADRMWHKAAFMAKALAEPVPFQPVKLGPAINSEQRWEYFPSLTADGQTLVFTALVDGQEDFYMSQYKEGTWQKAQPINDINTPGNEGAQSISANGKLLVYTGCDRKDGYGKCDLYFSEVKNGRWTTPKNMGKTINSAASDKQPALSADGRTMYFASNRSGGQGKYDLWVTYRNIQGSWSKPKNLGATINTSFDENFPFIHQDGQTLYFASEGHPGMGKYDLFFTQSLPDHNWAKPSNLGYPINTKNHETSLIISLNGRTAYFASDRDYLQAPNTPVKPRTPTDIYQFDLYEKARPQPVTYVRATVMDAEKESYLQAKVEFIDLESGQLHAITSSDEEGSFLVCLPTGKDYALHVSKEHYAFHSENFSLHNTASIEKPYLIKIELQPISPLAIKTKHTKAKPIILKNVFFDTGSAELRETSFIELDRLKKLLDDQPGIHIRINGHTDNVGSEQDNLLLSNQRAKAVYAYLVQKGIQPGRLEFKGFGESAPIAENDSEQGRQQNRRTEFVITANTKIPAKNP